jgi:hypothetical protein
VSDKRKLKDVITSLVLKEYEETRLDRSLLNVNCLLKLVKDTHVPDTLTRIRVLPTVSVVGQRSPVQRSESGAAVEVYIKFLPNSSDTYKNIMNIANLVKGLPGIKLVKVVALGGRDVSYKGQPIII